MKTCLFISIVLTKENFYISILLGSKTVETLSQRLAVAVKECNPEKIQKAINECLASGFPELEADVKKARKFLRSPQFYDAG
uniref:Uncharacterized protein n=1 Tax=Octopus bimaculoides TaxID=37653 RepID=A0A0L8FNE7_OCTBM